MNCVISLTNISLYTQFTVEMPQLKECHCQWPIDESSLTNYRYTFHRYFRSFHPINMIWLDNDSMLLTQSATMITNNFYRFSHSCWCWLWLISHPSERNGAQIDIGEATSEWRSLRSEQIEKTTPRNVRLYMHALFESNIRLIRYQISMEMTHQYRMDVRKTMKSLVCIA